MCNLWGLPVLHRGRNPYFRSAAEAAAAPMHSAPRLRPAALAAREKLAAGRAKLKAEHDRGAPGVEVSAGLAALLDRIILDLYRGAAAAAPGIEALVALVPLGGYGRRDVAPFSDVDLMVLHEPGADRSIAAVVRTLAQDIFDAGLQLGLSVRTPAEARSLATQEATAFTSLVDARLLAGSEVLYSRFQRSFRRLVLRRSRALVAAVEQARESERQQFGETVYLLQPNVKRSRGGLRDLQFLRWIGFARYGEREPENLVRAGLLAEEEHAKLRRAWEFLLRLRNELHFHAGYAQDVLGRNEQLRIAALFGYTGNAELLAVERFLRDYIEHTSEVRYVVAHFLSVARARASWRSLVGPLFSRRVGGDFRVDPFHIRATKRGLAKIRTDVAEVLRLMDLANRHQCRIDHATWVAVRQAMVDRPDVVISPAAAERFLSLMSQPGRLGSLLRRLHELRVLEKIIPPMAHARGLLQFNEYHKYTVDEHSILAVQRAADLLADPGPGGEAYRGIKDKRTLHLALLLHDLGKGYEEDHSEMGRKLAAETARHLGLGPAETENLVFLVHRHLAMSHLAQWRDINDDAVVVPFAVDAGSPERLQMLYVLTLADLAAVGPEALSSWKRDLLTRLYRRARQHLAGDTVPEASEEWLAQRREEVRALARNAGDPAWWDAQIGSLPRSYLGAASPQRILDELDRVRRLSRRDAVAWGHWIPEHKVVEYVVGTYEEITPGIFHKLTGALTSKGLQILSAEIHTLAQDAVLDRFFVQDLDFAAQPPAERLDEVCGALVASLKGHAGEPPAFRRLWAEECGGPRPRSPRLPTQVRIDNSSSDQFTILDIFAHDRMGLLYTIARTIFQLGLSVHAARIGTYFDQVVDVFYVTDQQGFKICDSGRLAEIRRRLAEEIQRQVDLGTSPGSG